MYYIINDDERHGVTSCEICNCLFRPRNPGKCPAAFVTCSQPRICTLLRVLKFPVKPLKIKEEYTTSGNKVDATRLIFGVISIVYPRSIVTRYSLYLAH
jgi:hypothetical protein